MSDIEDIKNRLDIVEVVREYVQLKQAGSNWKACCPFHNEKTPSFMVSKDKQIWHCFGCAEGGDVFKFIQKIEGVEFPEALRLLAEKAGVKLTRYNPEVSDKKSKLVEVAEAASRFFHAVLLNSDAGKIARDYLAKRQVSAEMIEQFRLGYAPDNWDSLGKALLKKGFSEEEIFLAGLTVKKDPSASLRTGKNFGFYDRFRGRLMFPIWDANNNVVGFTGRILGPEKEGVGKYVNTPETMLYNKSRVIYGLNFAKQEIRKNDLAILVEGNMDVIASHDGGVANAVASSGTALTVEQIKLLKRYTNNLALAFDSDPAGEGAAERGIDLALAEGLNIKVITLPAGFKDPDELVRSKPAGAEQWREAIKNSESIMEYYFQKTFKKYDKSKVEGKKKIAEILLAKIVKIPNQVEQTHWLQRLAELLSVPENILRSSFPKTKTVGKPIVDAKAFLSIDKNALLGEELLGLTLRHSRFLPKVVKVILPEMFNNPQLRDIYKEMVSYYNKYTGFDLDDFRKNLAEQDDFIERLLLLADKDFSDAESGKVEAELELLLKHCRMNYLANLKKATAEEIKLAEKGGDAAKMSELTEELQRLNEEWRKIN
ncbi:MAG: DNA primase [Patescibacteria group bacterium]|nr:DNA primase [Patescibacteria group bacterium]MDD5490639.1 DNA primase [Patescibacteria group bacterium]